MDEEGSDYMTPAEKEARKTIQESLVSDDDELVEREEFEIEENIAEFIDENHVRHNLYPDSDSDGEEASYVPLRNQNHVRQSDKELYDGQVFYNGVAFKEAVLDYVLRTGQNIKQYNFNCGSFCEDVENNSTESFNNTIVKAREKLMVPMLETVRRLAMVRISKRSIEANKHTGKCTPYVAKFLALEHKEASVCKVHRSTNGMFEVILSGCSHRVSMLKRTCSCQKWQITGIPCEHAYGVIINKKLQVDDYVNVWFHTSVWRNTYASSIIPLRGARFWPSGSAPWVSEPPEPPQPGRKKKTKKMKRKKGKNESPLKKKPKQLKLKDISLLNYSITVSEVIQSMFSKSIMNIIRSFGDESKRD